MRNNLDIVLVGCGGTGSFLAPSIIRSVAEFEAIQEQGNVDKSVRTKISVLFIDGDVVETKNIGRQNFAAADIGQFKSSVLANRYGGNFGVEVEYLTDYLTLNNIETLLRHFHGISEGSRTKKIIDTRRSDKIFISCVDNIHCRALVSWLAQVYNTFNQYEQTIWIDAGNELNFGQVFLSDNNASVQFSNFFTSNTDVLLKIFDVPDPELACENGGAQTSLANRVSASAADVMISAILDYYSKHNQVPAHTLLATASFNNTSYGNLVLDNTTKLNKKLYPAIQINSLLSATEKIYSYSRHTYVITGLNVFGLAALKFLEELNKPKSRKETRRMRKLYKRSFRISKILEELHVKYGY